MAANVEEELLEANEIEVNAYDCEAIQSSMMSDDEEEPYCMCLEPNNLFMIACEGRDCDIQWFHYSCVGIDPNDIPDGDWFCKECSSKSAKNIGKI